MPISIVTRIRGRSRGLGTAGTPGLQQCKRDLKLTGVSIVRLDPSIFNAPGSYTLFTYNTFYTQPGNTAQQQINTYLTVDDSLLPNVRLSGGAVIDTAAKRIGITLVNR